MDRYGAVSHAAMFLTDCSYPYSPMYHPDFLRQKRRTTGKLLRHRNHLSQGEISWGS